MSTWSARRINALVSIVGARRYLEIGVWRGDTITRVSCDERVGVDVAFAFDAHDSPDGTLRFIERPSDDYFASLDPADSFDVVFLDGLHTFEQTYRDFCSTLLHLAPGGIIVVDDVVPEDVFGALPSKRDALAQRAAHGLTGGQWWGDVYKIAFTIHDFHPTLAYAIVSGSDNAQLVAWRAAPGPARSRISSSLAEISQLDFFAFQRLVGELHHLSEEDLLAAVRTDLRREPEPALSSGRQGARPLPRPGAPCLTGAEVREGRIHASWNPSTDESVLGFQLLLYREITDSQPSAHAWAEGPMATSVVSSPLRADQPEHLLFISLRAKNESGWSAESDRLAVMLTTPPQE